MIAALLRQTGANLTIESGLQFEPLRRGQVLVKLAYSGVCQSQLMEVRGRRGLDVHLPHLLGHEGSGQVIEIGPGVSKVRPGDFVIVGWIKGSGIESAGTKCRLNGETINAGAVTTFNDFAVVSENRIVQLMEGIPLDVAVLFGCALPTGAGIVMNEIQPSPGSSIALFGLGGIGMSALIATRLFDCKTVIAVDVSDAKLELAREFGATATINSMKQDPAAEIAALTDGRGVDYSVEASGSAAVIEMAFQSVRTNGGLCIFASHPPAGDVIRIDPHEMIKGKQLRGSWGGATNPDRDIPRLMQLYLDGKLPLEKLLSRPYPLDAINQALDDLESGRVARPLIEIDSSMTADR